ncbi:MAG: SDR family NAD(P)-dependent oxidoreductase [Dehalococcoidia bacterium]
MRGLIPRGRGVIRLVLSLVLDAGIIVAGYAVALLLRFDADVPRISWDTFRTAAPLIVAAYLAAFFISGIYRTAWQYGGVGDVLNLGRAVLLVTILIFAINYTREIRHIPLSVNLIAGVLIFLGSGFVKMAPRLVSYRSWTASPAGAKRLMIVGAGNTGQFVAREFRTHRDWLHQPVCFVDDDRRKFGVRVHRIPVAGTIEDIPALARQYAVDVVAVALPSAPGAKVREIVTLCQGAGVPVRMVPGLPEIVQQPGGAALRDLTVEDLIGREPVDIDFSECLESLQNKVVLITGAAGSIGSELARQVLTFAPAGLHLLDNNETGLHDLRLELEPESAEVNLRTWIADIASEQKLAKVFDAVRPEIVFHAAAFKHVPMMEEHPDEALRVNVQGTLNVCRAADRTGAQKLIFISTDKAINPSSVMGASKRIGELILLTLAQQSRTTFCAVRFVNVIGSRGSVVSTFSRQIDEGGPVTVTDPAMRRYYLTIPEAVSLVIQAAAFAGQGQIYMLDIGEEIRIVDLAEKMIRMRGLTPGTDVPIVYTGAREGEKFREDLVAGDEAREPTHHPKVLHIRGQVRESLAVLEAEIAALSAADLDRAALARRLHALAGNAGGQSDPVPLDDRR